MTPHEAMMLCRYVAACCPQQKFDEYTPDAWHDLLGDLPFDLAKKAAAEVAKRQPFVAPAEIREAVKRMRSATLEALHLELGVWDVDGRESFHEWRDRRAAEISAAVDDAIRGGGATFGRVDVLTAGPDETWNQPVADLVRAIAAELPVLP